MDSQQTRTNSRKDAPQARIAPLKPTGGLNGPPALSIGADAIGLIPAGGGARTFARSFGNWSGYRGIVADNFGKAAIKQAKGGAGTFSLTQGVAGQDLISTGLSVAGFIPVLGQAAAGASIVYDGYKTWKAIKSCP
jgi:hypothetical protein